MAEWWGNGDRGILAGLVGAWFGGPLGKQADRQPRILGDIAYMKPAMKSAF